MVASPLLSLTGPAELVLRRRLEALGLHGIESLQLHTNRTVMLSWGQGVLRIHRGYTMAPDRVLLAIVRFLRPRVPPRLRRALEHQFLSFPADLHAPPRPPRGPAPERARPADRLLISRLAEVHDRLNREHFGGALNSIPFRLSGRMRTRLGEFSVNVRTGEPVAITISRSHVRSERWEEVEHTVLHEMVHQWQVETGRPLDHGAEFRRKAREVGIQPRARRLIDR